MLYHVTFDKITLTKIKHCKCTSCGKKIRRQRTDYQTLSPYNKNADGKPKTAGEIRADLADELDKWAKEPEVCNACSR